MHKKLQNHWLRSSFIFCAALAGALADPAATPVDHIKIAKDFKVERLYNVPKKEQGSWVNLCVDPKGRLIASDQYGGLYRITTPAPGGSPGDTKVEKIPADIREAQGLLWAFDSLYVVVNTGGKHPSGLYRVRSSKGDDQLDTVETLRVLEGGGGEHGPHAVLLSPDGKSLYVVCGNQTKLTKIDHSRVPPVWSEDHLLPRMPDGNGFMAGVLGPGGVIYKVTPDGKEWSPVSVGFRNEFDAAFNRQGDLFTYDADMEWDMNTPWYRPTRVCLVASGAEYGWRNGTGKRPPYYADNLPPVIEIGPGSPTGVTFGYGAKFPAKYQEAFFMCDWSYGKLYAVHLTPEGSTYKAEKEEFAAAAPLPLTDVVINPKDGALYFTVGGRQVQSALYRITYTGKESTAPARPTAAPPLLTARRKLEAFHGHPDPAAVKTAWPFLGNSDRFLRWAARVAIEHQPVAEWSERALTEKDPQASLEAILALVQVSAKDSFHRKPSDPPVDSALQGKVLAALDRMDWNKLSHSQRLALIRDYQLVFTRLGKPDDETANALAKKLDAPFPAPTRELNSMLSELLIYLQSPTAAAKTMALLAKAPTQEEQIDFVKSLRMLKTGWTMELRKEYFSWFLKAASYRGGSSFANFVRNIKTDAVKRLTTEEREELTAILNAKPGIKSPLDAMAAALAGRTTVKEWTVEELAPLLDKGLKNRNFQQGRQMVGAVGCFACHRFNNDGGSAGPDLTAVAGRFSPRDLLESILLPSKQISDQYANVIITQTNGEKIIGRIVNLSGNSLHVSTNMFDPNEMAGVDSTKVKSTELSKVSPMPEGLLGLLKQDEILDLMAYLLSRGDASDKMFAPQKK